MSDKKQSSVDFYRIESQKLMIKAIRNEISNDEWRLLENELGNQAKAMHKEDIERFNKFLNDEKKLGIADLKTIERIQWYYNTYFNETFGGNNE